MGSITRDAIVNLSLCWVPPEHTGRYLVVRVAGSQQDPSAAARSPHPLTSGILYEGGSAHVLEAENSASQKWKLIPRPTLEFHLMVFVSWLDLCCAGFLFLLLRKYFDLQRYFH